MDRNIEVVAELFMRDEVLQEFYDNVHNGFKQWEKTVLPKYLKKGSSVLDVGCGAGREAFALCDLGYRVTGIDISEKQIAFACQKAKDLKKDVVFRKCTGLDLDFPDGSYDHIIMCSQAFGNVYGHDNQVRLLKEFHRVLKSRGIACFSGHVYDYVKEFYGQYTDGKKFFGYKDTDCYWELFTIEELIGLSEEAGFKVVECKNSTELGSDIDKQVLVCVVEKPAKSR